MSSTALEQTLTPVSSSPTPSPQSTVTLIPWDPDSVDHWERLRLQRLACGWKYQPEWIQKWATAQKAGKIALQWVVFTNDDPDKTLKLEKHTTLFPQEYKPLVDSATNFGGKNREPSGTEFVPVGHISLDSTYEEPQKVAPSENGEGIYWIATFYVSTALQRYGLGRAAMDWVEEMACREPLSAKVLKLSTAAKDGTNRAERIKAMGRQGEGQLSVQDWYARRGFELYNRKEAMWFDTDKTGKVWPITGVFMKKEIKQT